MTVRAARGAITVPADAKDAVFDQTSKLVTEMMRRNRVVPDQLISIFFTATPDLRSAFPAEAARQLGLTGVPLLCAQEIDVRDAMARVIRVLMLFETPRSPAEIEHVYLDGAEALRDDLR